MTAPDDLSPLDPTPAERVARARAEMRLGLPVVLSSGGRHALVAAVETLSPARFAALRALGGAPLLSVTARRAATLKARAYDGDLARLRVPAGADAAWLAAVADPKDDLAVPMKGPLISERGGDATFERAGLVLAKQARLLPAVLSLPLADPTAAGAGRVRLDLDRADPAALEALPPREVVAARLPVAVSAAGRLHVFRPGDGGEEHYAVEIGEPPRDAPVLARLHSACFTGDVLGSLKCDCGAQLKAALTRIGTAGAGVLLYLNQEGRGIGLANKMRAYALQDQGFDTVEANHRLGFEDDERDFRLGAQMLRGLGFAAVRLMTNNPAKVAMMRASGVAVAERVPLAVGLRPENAAYLATKARKSGHLL